MKQYRDMAKADHAAKVRAMGGKVKDHGAHGAHSDAAEDKKMIEGMVKKGELKGDVAKIEGRAMGGRLDRPQRGGAHKHKKGDGTNITIAVMPKPDAGPGAAEPPMMSAPRPPMAPPVMMAKGPGPMAPPMGGPGPGGPGGPMGAKKGGVVHRAKGGKIDMEAGAGSGEGRLEKIKDYGKKAKA